MIRLLATTALAGTLLAAPAWAQTMNSAPTPAPAASGTAAQPHPSDRGKISAPQAKRHRAPAESSGSSVRTTRKSKSADKSADNSADQLNRQELQQLGGR